MAAEFRQDENVQLHAQDPAYGGVEIAYSMRRATMLLRLMQE
ncbi:hypothetical protein [Bradyrhizobium sp.]|nr:hypothetical protein [Bradyrhizobium sp.]